MDTKQKKEINNLIQEFPLLAKNIDVADIINSTDDFDEIEEELLARVDYDSVDHEATVAEIVEFCDKLQNIVNDWF